MAAVATVKFWETGSQLVRGAGKYWIFAPLPPVASSFSLPLCLALQHLRDLDHDGDLDVVLGVRNGDSLVTEVGIEHGVCLVATDSRWSQLALIAWLDRAHPGGSPDRCSWHGLKIVELPVPVKPLVVGLWTCGEFLHSLCICERANG
jgi:hypothetical protein